jgi:hypothetical protein
LPRPIRYVSRSAPQRHILVNLLYSDPIAVVMAFFAMPGPEWSRALHRNKAGCCSLVAEEGM